MYRNLGLGAPAPGLQQHHPDVQRQHPQRISQASEPGYRGGWGAGPSWRGCRDGDTSRGYCQSHTWGRLGRSALDTVGCHPLICCGPRPCGSGASTEARVSSQEFCPMGVLGLRQQFWQPQGGEGAFAPEQWVSRPDAAVSRVFPVICFPLHPISLDQFGSGVVYWFRLYIPLSFWLLESQLLSVHRVENACFWWL